MAVYQYTVTVRQREDHAESGTVVAQNEQEAKTKLKQLFSAEDVRLRRVPGLSGFLRSFTADVKKTLA